MDFTPEQQKVIDGLINKRIAEIKGKHETALQEAVIEASAKAQSELSTLKAENETLLRERDAQKERIRTAILEAKVARTDAVSVAQITKLISDAFIIGDDGGLVVVDEKGIMRLDNAGRPLTAEVFLEGFLDANPHLKKAARMAGAGSISAMGFSGLLGATTTRRSDFNQMSPSRQAEFIRGGGRLTE